MLLNNKITILFSFLLVVACGSSSPDERKSSGAGSSSSGVENPPVTTDIPEIDIICEGIARLPISDVSSTASTFLYPPVNVIDGNFIAESRWTSSSNNATLTLKLNDITLLKGLSITWLNNDTRTYSYDIELSRDNINWVSALSSELSDSSSDRSQYIEIPESTTQYIKVIPTGNNIDNTVNIVEIEAFGCRSDIVSPIALNDWYLSIPVDELSNSKALSIYEKELNDEYFNPEFFFHSLDNGLVFRTPIEGAKTSSNTKYTRTELREMLRSGNTSISTKGVNKNNWVFSTAPLDEKLAAGGVDGDLAAELSVNHVTTTGNASQVGRVIIGQIHANNDEPIRVYYRKLPNNDKGAIYFAHEIHGGDDVYFELIGSRSQSASNPVDGIKLNERFSYRISVVGHQLTFILSRPDKQDISKTIDMSLSGYNIANEYMYFKAGVYNQNNTGDDKDYVQATFYGLDNTH